MQKSKDKFGEDIHDPRLPSHSHFEAFEEKHAYDDLHPETLAQIISLAQETEQKAQKPEMSRQRDPNLDSTLTIQTRYLSKMPTPSST